MKRTLGVFLGLGIVIGLGYVLFGGSTMEVNNRPEVIATSTDAVVVKPTAAELLETATQELIKEAITASSTEIEAAKVAAAAEVENRMKLEIERTVRAELQASNDSRIDEIDKETKAY